MAWPLQRGEEMRMTLMTWGAVSREWEPEWETSLVLSCLPQVCLRAHPVRVKAIVSIYRNDTSLHRSISNLDQHAVSRLLPRSELSLIRCVRRYHVFLGDVIELATLTPMSTYSWGFKHDTCKRTYCNRLNVGWRSCCMSMSTEISWGKN